MAIIGIDLGTTNSAVAVYRNGQAEIVPNDSHQRTTASVFQVKPNGEEVIGSVAKKSAASLPKSTILEIKRLMGSTDTVTVQGTEYRPEEISSKILRYLRQSAEKFLNENVEEAVITVPAYFTDAQRKATKDAGELAGFKVERIINEPTAAALAFCHDNLDENRYLLVYDLGGGTFDVSIVEVFEGIVEVKSSVGDNELGGADFDAVLMNQIQVAFRQHNGYDMESIATDRDMLYYTLKEAAENAKIALSSQVEADIMLPFIGLKDNFPVSFQMTLRRADFEREISDMIDTTMDKVHLALQEAGLQPSDISEVLMVGGSTRVPYVQEQVRHVFGQKIRTDVNPDEVVAQGAAVQAGLKSGAMSGQKQKMVAVDVCPYTLGTAVENPDGGPELFDPLILKNTPIPFQTTKRYWTVSRNQTQVLVTVHQGEEKYAYDNVLVSDDFLVQGIPKNGAGEESIDITFGYDINGIIELEVEIVSTGQSSRHIVQTGGVMAAEEKIESLQRMEAEQEAALLIEHVKQAIHRAERLRESVSLKDQKRLDTLIERGKHALETGNERQLKAADQQLLDLIIDLI